MGSVTWHQGDCKGEGLAAICPQPKPLGREEKRPHAFEGSRACGLFAFTGKLEIQFINVIYGFALFKHFWAGQRDGVWLGAVPI